MSVSTNTKAVLEEMRKAGVDPTILASLERDIDSKPAADKVVSDGILAQSSFNSYRTNKDNEIAELKTNLARLANLQGAASGLTGDLQTAAVEQIAALEKIFVDQGYSLEEVRSEAAKLVTNPDAIKALAEKKDEKITSKEKEMPNPQNGNYVDAKTLADTLLTTGTNLAVGGINASIHIARALREADKLGIELTDQKLDTFSTELVKGLEVGKNPTQVMDEFFGFSTVRAEKDKKTREAELEAAKQEGAREALKANGITIRKSILNRKVNPNPIMDRKRLELNREEKKEDVKLEDLPKNEKGDPEYFRLRNFDLNTRRSVHTENAVNRFAEVEQEYDTDGMYIGNRQ